MGVAETATSMLPRDGCVCHERWIVEEALHRSFGYVIAYILPGLVALYGCRVFQPDWAGIQPPACGGELALSAWILLLLGALGVGLIVSALRWLTIDTLHQATGLSAPRVDFGRLHDQLDVFLVAVEHSYRYYQFYSNLAISLVFVTAVHLSASTTPWSWKIYATICALLALLLAASRDCLRRYYDRLSQLLDPGRL
jgi:hypothetical protein